MKKKYMRENKSDKLFPLEYFYIKLNSFDKEAIIVMRKRTIIVTGGQVL